MMERMILRSSFFKSRKNLSQEIKLMKEKRCQETPRGFQEEEGPCTSYSHKEEDKKHGGHLDHQILIEYLFQYKSQPRASKETLAFPQFIQLEEERSPSSTRRIKGNRFLFSTFDGRSAAKSWARRLSAFFLLHPVVEKEAVEIAALEG